MSDVVIRAKGLGKKYTIGHIAERERYKTVRDIMTRSLRGFVSSVQNLARSHQIVPGTELEEFWALQNVNFEVNRGDVIGIIGRNGAGKSTLLKILSQITEPTTGRVEIKGRVASLLEVGTGFHPELTGRENIYLNGAILGMTRSEIKRKFDEIVSFSEVERFLDTPVKRYSSGMHVRLAFAVAAHLEPEILVVDEVLAVGDAEFQKKCLGKMRNVANQGRTVLFVSHNMGVVGNLCSRSILLEDGAVRCDGSTPEVITEFYSGFERNQQNSKNPGFEVDHARISNDGSGDGMTLTNLAVSNPNQPAVGPMTGDPLVIKLCYQADCTIPSPAFVVSIKDGLGTELVRLSTQPISAFDITPLYDHGVLELRLASLPLVGGRYYVDIGFVHEKIRWIFDLPGIMWFDVIPADVYSSGMALDQQRGRIVIKHSWHHTETPVHSSETATQSGDAQALE